MKLTSQQLNAARSERGGYGKRQIQALGLTWPPVKGWTQGHYTEAQIEAFVRGKKEGKKPATTSELFGENETTTAIAKTYRIHFDGGARGAGFKPGEGNGYGSWRYNGGSVRTVEHGGPMTANAAEVLTLCVALEHLAKHVECSSTAVLIQGDSMIALKWANPATKKKISAGSSPLFQEAISRLHAITTTFARVTTEWLPREHAVAAFGH